jgi:S1-C subfamily serine protease
MNHIKKLTLGIASALCVAGLMDGVAWAQRAPQPKDGASIIVDGIVREIFRSPRQTLVDYVVQVEVSRSEYGPRPADPKRVQAPAPGDQIYIHVFQPTPDSRQRPGVGGHTLPAERSQIRAYLYPRAQGGWEGAFPDWFDQAGVVAQNRASNEPEPPAEVAPVPVPTTPPSSGAPAAAGSIVQRLGIRAEQVQVSGRLVLKIVDVAPDGPAGKAGIEPGDAIIGVNGGFITDLDQMATTILKGGSIATLAVLDSRNGKQTPVKVDVSGLIAEDTTQRRPEPPPATVPTRVLGVKTEQVRVGLRTIAARVTEVQDGSPAAKAGIERGDVILEADGVPASDAAQLEAAIQRSGPVLTLKVLDPRTRREVPVPVHFDRAGAVTQGSNPAPGNTPFPAPAPVPGSGSLSARSIGIVAEAGTADLLPVVKVVQVVPGSPAEKAGIESGDAIVGLNDKVIFAPDLLDEALRTAGNSFTLNVLDVKTGKKTPVKINVQ